MSDFIRQFNESLQYYKIPYADFLKNNSDLMAALENEFYNTPEKPSLNKFRRAFLSDERRLQDWEENRGKYSAKVNDILDKLELMFYSLVSTGELHKEYYEQDIEQTNIVIQLKAISKIMEGFREMRNYNPAPDSLIMQAQETGKAIIAGVKKINHVPLRKAVIDNVINDNENVNLASERIVEMMMPPTNKKDFAGQEKDWGKAKMFLNNYLTEKYNHNDLQLLNNPDLVYDKDQLKVIANGLEFLQYIKKCEGERLVSKLLNPDDKSQDIIWQKDVSDLVWFITKIYKEGVNMFAFGRQIFKGKNFEKKTIKKNRLPKYYIPPDELNNIFIGL